MRQAVAPLLGSMVEVQFRHIDGEVWHKAKVVYHTPYQFGVEFHGGERLAIPIDSTRWRLPI